MIRTHVLFTCMHIRLCLCLTVLACTQILDTRLTSYKFSVAWASCALVCVSLGLTNVILLIYHCSNLISQIILAFTLTLILNWFNFSFIETPCNTSCIKFSFICMFIEQLNWLKSVVKNEYCMQVMHVYIYIIIYVYMYVT